MGIVKEILKIKRTLKPSELIALTLINGDVINISKSSDIYTQSGLIGLKDIDERTKILIPIDKIVTINIREKDL